MWLGWGGVPQPPPSASTVGTFSCIAGNTQGTFANYCTMNANGGACPEGPYFIGNLVVSGVSPPPPPPPPPPTGCTPNSFVGGAVSPSSVWPGQPYTVTCDYGYVGGCIGAGTGSWTTTPVWSGTWGGGDGTTTSWTFIAGPIPGSYFAQQCWVGGGCTQCPNGPNNLFPGITVLGSPPPPPSATPPPPTACNPVTLTLGTVSASSVTLGGGFNATCNYGVNSPEISLNTSAGFCTGPTWAGTTAIWSCTATSIGTYGSLLFCIRSGVVRTIQ